MCTYDALHQCSISPSKEDRSEKPEPVVREIEHKLYLATFMATWQMSSDPAKFRVVARSPFYLG